MGPTESNSSRSLPFAAQQRIDQVCTRFDQAWRAGPRPDLRDYLAGTGPERAALFRELLRVELEYRLQRNEHPTAEEYRQRFPEEDADVAALLEELIRDANTPEPPLSARWSGSRAAESFSTERTRRGEPPVPPALPERYRIERVLGQGAFGVVYLARDEELHRNVAIKVAHQAKRLANSSDAFLGEARVLASLDHPAILPIYDVGRVEGRSYLVTKLIEGSNLSERLRQALPAHRQAAQWLAAIARALQTAHDKGLVHRDVKPSNILLDTADRAYIGDFGLALSEEHFGEGPRLLGTPAYMSPEQALGEGHRVDARSDVFSLGVVLYELLTGRPPFQAESVTRTLRQVVYHEPVAPRRLNPAIGRDLDTICLKCLEKRPERRYAGAQALAEDLERFLDGRTILARPAGRVEKLIRWSRRNPMSAASLAGIVLCFVTAFVLVSWSYVRAERAFEEETGLRQEAQRREKIERWERYRSNLVAAASALEVENVAAAGEALDVAPLEYRNWEWRHFHHRLDTARQVLRLPGGPAAVLLSADGNQAIVPSASGIRYIPDLRARPEVRVLTLDLAATVAALRPDGGTVAGARGKSVVLWDTRTNRERAVLRGPQTTVISVLFSPDGKRLAAAAADGTMHAWDTVSGQELPVLRGHGGSFREMVFSPDGRRLASAGGTDKALHVWELSTGQLLAVLDGHDPGVSRLCFSPRGDRILAGVSYPSNTVRLWDAATGELLAILRGHSNQIESMAFSPDGKRIACGSLDQTVCLWDGESGKLLATLTGHKDWVVAVAFSPDGKRLASASHDQTVRVWDAETGAPVGVLRGHTSSCRDVHYAAGGTTLIAGAADGGVRLWDTQLAEHSDVLSGHESFVYDVAFHPDGRRVVSGSWDGTLRIWDATTGRQLSLLRYPRNDIVGGIAIHPDGKRLAAIGRDDQLCLGDLDTGEELGRLRVVTDNSEYKRAAFSPRGDLLACGSTDHAVHVWRIDDPHPGEASEAAVFRGHGDAPRVVVFSPDETWLASGGGAGDPTVRVWDLARKEATHVLHGHTDTITSLALTRDGRWLASGSGDGTVRLWDTTSWSLSATLNQGTIVYGVAFSPDGSRLACACSNNTIRLWDLATRQAVCDLQGHRAYVHQVAFSPDGTRLVSGSGDFTVRVWDSLSRAERMAR